MKEGESRKQGWRGFLQKGDMVTHVERGSAGEWGTASRGMYEDQSVRIGGIQGIKEGSALS